MEIDKLNRAIMDIKSEGYTYPTQYAYLQEAYDRIIVPTGVKNSGTIRTLEQVNDFLDRRFGGMSVHMTQEEYDKELNSLLSKLEPIDTVDKFLQSKREEYFDVFDTYLGDTSDTIKNLPTAQLRDMINEAWRRAKADPDGSPTFIEHLMDIIAEEA